MTHRSRGPTTTNFDADGASRYFEDFAVGECFRTGEREIVDTDLVEFAALSGDTHKLHTDPEYAACTRFGRPIVHGPFGIACFFGLFNDLHLIDDSVIALLDTNWRYLAPLYVGDRIRARITITRCTPSSDSNSGVLERHIEMLNQDDVVFQEGTSAVLVAVGGAAPRLDRCAFGTVEWARGLREPLHADPAFTEALSTWDGAIGLRSGTHEVHLRLYKGQIIDVSERSVHGSTFTVAGTDKVWTDMIFGDENDFMKRAMSGQFTVTGSGYEYLRLTGPLIAIVDAARTCARESDAK